MKATIISMVCNALTEGKIEDARRIVEVEYPHRPLMLDGRCYTAFQSITIFIRDGFIDRYSGQRLVFPPVLRLVSNLMPDAFPFQKNWKMSECHIAYWHLFPTIDHIIPVSRGGEDKDVNWVSTSMLRNSAKSQWLLEELGWVLHSPGDLKEWDGLIHWFMKYTKDHPEILNDSYISKWRKAAIRAIKTEQTAPRDLRVPLHWGKI